MITTRINTSPEHLRKLINRLSLSAEDLAAMAGVHRTSAFNWLAGRARIPVSVIRMLELTVKDQKNDR